MKRLFMDGSGVCQRLLRIGKCASQGERPTSCAFKIFQKAQNCVLFDFRMIGLV